MSAYQQLNEKYDNLYSMFQQMTDKLSEKDEMVKELQSKVAEFERERDERKSKDLINYDSNNSTLKAINVTLSKMGSLLETKVEKVASNLAKSIKIEGEISDGAIPFFVFYKKLKDKMAFYGYSSSFSHFEKNEFEEINDEANEILARLLTDKINKVFSKKEQQLIDEYIYFSTTYATDGFRILNYLMEKSLGKRDQFKNFSASFSKYSFGSNINEVRHLRTLMYVLDIIKVVYPRNNIEDSSIKEHIVTNMDTKYRVALCKYLSTEKKIAVDAGSLSYVCSSTETLLNYMDDYKNHKEEKDAPFGSGVVNLDPLPSMLVARADEKETSGHSPLMAESYNNNH